MWKMLYRWPHFIFCWIIKPVLFCNVRTDRDQLALHITQILVLFVNDLLLEDCTSDFICKCCNSNVH